MGIFDFLSGQSRRRTEPPLVEPPLLLSSQHSALVTRETGFAVIDFETTGLSPKINRVAQIAVVLTSPDGELISRWSTFINPDGQMEATHIHGITDADVRTAPKFKDIADELRERLQGYALAAHNMRFDSSFLKAEYLRLGWQVPEVPSLCTYA